MKNTLRPRLMSLVALACLAAAPAFAGGIVKQVAADGRVIYTDSAVPGLKIEKTIKVDTSSHGSKIWTSNPGAMPAGISGAAAPGEAYWPANPGTPGRPIALANLPPLPGSSQGGLIDVATVIRTAAGLPNPDQGVRLPDPIRVAGASEVIDLRQAQIELDAAVAALKAGETPQPGERTGNANGSSRLNPAYFERQAQLKAAVAQAQERLANAR